jgi:autotransporter-associated beta strand protein
MVLTLGATALTLGVTNVAGHDLTWNGGTTGTWNVAPTGSTVWTSVQAPTTDMYYDTDNVTFGPQSGAAIITLQNAYSTGMVPGNVTVNSSTDYTFNAFASATDKISGTTGLTKDGAGSLTINLANDYLGTTDIKNGKIKLGTATALGSASAPLIIENGATLDLNIQQLYAKPVTVQGDGVLDGLGHHIGAIVNNSATNPGGTQYDISYLTLSGNTTIGGTAPAASNPGLPLNQLTGRWAVRAQTGMASITTSGGGQPYTLTKTGNNQIMLVNTAVDTGVGNVIVNEGVLGLEGTTTLGNPSSSYSVTVDGMGAPGTGQLAGGSILQLNRLTVYLNKNVLLKNNGQLYALLNNADDDNTVLGTVSIDSTGGILNAGGTRDDYTSNTPNAASRLTISGAISGSGPMIKRGPGTVTLSNATSAFNGPTSVEDGTLAVNGILKGSVTMHTSTTLINSVLVTTVLAGNGTIGGTGDTVTDAPSTIIAPGPNYSSTSASVGTLAMNNLTINSAGGGTIKFDVSTTSSGSNDLLNINNNLSLTGSGAALTNILINETSGQGSITNGTYNLINYAHVSATPLANLHLTGLATGSRRTYNLDNSITGQINLKVGGTSASLTWKGDTGVSPPNKWNVADALNHVWTGASPDAFYNLDSVTFDGNGNNNPIDINDTNGYVQPSSITVTNSTGHDYTFNGSSKITGQTGLAKSGSGKLILNNGSASNMNDFTGPITINAGILQIGDGATDYTSIGSSSVITNNSQLIFNQTSTGKGAVSATISGTGSLEQKGSSSTLTLSGTNDYTGVTTVSAGALQAGNNSALGSTVAGTTISSGATLDINNMNLGSEQITVAGPGVGGTLTNGAIVNSNQTTSNTPQQALKFVTLTGDTTFGGISNAGAANSGRWDIRGTTSSMSSLLTGGHDYSLTKVGNNQVSLVATNVDTALKNVNINQGVLELELNSTLGDPTKTVTVDGSSGSPESLDGGTLQLYNLSTPLDKVIVLQNGGSLYVKSNSLATDNTVAGSITISGSGILNAGGVRNDITTAVSGTTMTINGAIGGTGSDVMTKNGPGTVILNAATNTFSGIANINDGTLIVNGSLPCALNISQSPTTGIRTTLSGTGTIGGAAQDGNNTIIAPGATAALGSIGTLHFDGDLMIGGNGQGQINFDLTSDPAGTNDLIDLTNVAGHLSLYTTTLQINPTNGYLGIGTYHLIHYAGSLSSGNSGSLSPSGLPDGTRQTYNLSDASNYINLVVGGTAPATLTWVGGSGGSNAWDVKTTTNWSGPSDHLFYNADQVSFTDSSANTSVDITATAVLPSSITVNSSSGHDYTFMTSGTGKISGGTSLTKMGTSTLTLATSNDYSGQTTVQNGTLLVTGSIGDNSPVLVSGGTLKAGSNLALGTNSTVGTTVNGGTLDINAMSLQTETVTVQGAGVVVSGQAIGAIVNSGAAQANALTHVILSGNATFGGSGEWDIRGTSASLSTGGLSLNLTKTGANTIDLVSVAVDTALADITINQGTLKFEDSTTFGDATKTVTIDSAGTLQFLKATNAMARHIDSNGGTISASSNNTSSTQNTVSGTVTVNSTTTVNANNAAGILSFTNLINGNGGLDKTGPGNVIITGVSAYNGDTAVDGGLLDMLDLNTPSATVSINNSGSTLSVESIVSNTLNMGSGTTLDIKPIAGGYQAMGRISPVPEPATWAMLMLAAMGLGIYWRRTR